MKFLRRLEFYWRIVATGFAFATFGIFALVLSCGIFPIFYLLMREKSRHHIAQHGIHLSFFCFIAMIRKLRIADFRFENLELLNEATGCLFVANHPTLLDYVLITSLVSQLTCIVKKSLLKNWFCRGMISSANYIASQNAEEFLHICKKRLTKGENILIFPEGTRTDEHQLLNPLQRGAANVAIRCNCPLRLIHITCSPRVLGKTKQWWQVPATRPQFRIRIGKEIDVQKVMNGATSEANAVRSLNKILANAFLTA